MMDRPMLIGPDGSSVDTRYGWFVVIRVLYGDIVQSAKPAV